MSTLEDKGFSPEAIDRLITQIIDLGRVNLTSDPSTAGINSLSTMLVEIVDRRSKLSRIQGRVLVAGKRSKAKLTHLKAEIKIGLDELLTSDNEVKRASNQRTREARARQRLAPQYEEMKDLEEEVIVFDGILEACAIADKNLTQAKEAVSKQTQIASLDLQASGMPPMPQVIPKVGRSGL